MFGMTNGEILSSFVGITSILVALYIGKKSIDIQKDLAKQATEDQQELALQASKDQQELALQASKDQKALSEQAIKAQKELADKQAELLKQQKNILDELNKAQQNNAGKQEKLLEQQKDILAALKKAQEEIANKQADLLTEQEKRLQEMENISKQSILNERKTATIRAYTDLFEDVLTWLEYKGGPAGIQEEILRYMDEAATQSKPTFFYHVNRLQGMKEYVNKIQRIIVFAAGITPKEGIEPLYDWDKFVEIGGTQYFKDRIIDRLKAFYVVCKIYNNEIGKLGTDDNDKISLSNFDDPAFKKLIAKCKSNEDITDIKKEDRLDKPKYQKLMKIIEKIKILFPAP